VIRAVLAALRIGLPSGSYVNMISHLFLFENSFLHFFPPPAAFFLDGRPEIFQISIILTTWHKALIFRAFRL